MLNITQIQTKNFGERDGWDPDILVIHISGGTEKSMDNWFQNPASQASSNYGLGLDGITIHQYVSEDKAAWAQGLRWVNGVAYSGSGKIVKPTSKIVLSRPGINPNKYCLSIENEGFDLKNASEPQRKLLYNLILDICKRHPKILLDREHILGHYEISPIERSYCPSPDHTIMDKIVESCKTIVFPEEMILIQVKKSLVEKVKAFINSLTT